MQFQEKIYQDQKFRKQLGENNFYWFNHIYFPQYITYPTANFQREIYSLLEKWESKFLEIIAFRGSAKTMITMLGFPIWAVITKKVKFPVLLSNTFLQTKIHIYNLKTELEHNELLIKDYGPFIGKEEWTATDIVLPEYDVRITAKSKGQKIRGIRHRQYRPDLIIADDIEDSNEVRTKERRDETFKWFNMEVIPAGDKNTRYILIGNLLHRDSFMSRMKEVLNNKIRDGTCREFSFFDKNGEPVWQGKFSDSNLIEDEKRKYDDRTWQREFLLRIIPEEGQEIKDEWIQYYEKIPEQDIFYQGTGIDLAISKTETANFTAMVSGKLLIVNGIPKIYIIPYPVNERLSSYETIEKARVVSLGLGVGTLTPLWVEDVAYQRAAVEGMQRVGLPAEGVKVSSDKRARLRTTSVYIQNGTVLFPRQGCEDLINQLTGFGIETYDDLCDAFTLLVQALMNFVAVEPKLTII